MVVCVVVVWLQFIVIATVGNTWHRHWLSSFHHHRTSHHTMLLLLQQEVRYKHFSPLDRRQDLGTAQYWHGWNTLVTRCTGSENREQSRFHSQPIMRDSAVTRPRETRDKAINTSLVSTKTSESKNIPPHKSDGGETSRQSQEKLGKGTTSKQSSAASKEFATDRRRGIKVVPLPPSTHDSSTDMTFDPPCRSFVDMVAADLDDDDVALDRPPSQQTLTHNYYNELNYVWLVVY